MEAVDVRGRFVWHELLTRDAAAAKTFYSKLAGWKAQAWPSDPNYTICHSEHGPTAGIMPITPDLPAEMPAHWMGYIGSHDVDGTADAAVRAGASLLSGPKDIPGAGRCAVLKDPQGAVFAILNPENARAEVDQPPLGTFSWHELATSDHEAAFAFYGELFGWKPITRMEMGPAGTYLIFGSNGIQRGGMYIKPAEMSGPPHWLSYAHVPSADATAKWAVGAGAQLKQAPMDVPGGRVAVFIDPTGAVIAVHSLNAAAAQPAAQAVTKPAKVAKPSKAAAKPEVKAASKPKAKAKAKAKTSKASAKPAKRKPAKKAAVRGKAKAAKKSTPRGKAPAKKKAKSVRRKK